MTTPQKKSIRNFSNEVNENDDQQSQSNRILKLDKARQRMTALQLSLESHSSELKERIIKRKAEHAKSLAEEKENQSKVKEEIENLKKKEFEVIHDIERERQELSEVKRHISELSKQMRSLSTNRDGLIAEIEEYRERINNHKKASDNERKILNGQQSRNEPELIFFEQKLGFKLRSDKTDFLIVSFTQIDDREPNRQFSLELDLSQIDYKVSKCNPQLDNIDQLVNSLNHSRGFYSFIKLLRSNFKDYVKSEKLK